MAQKNILQYLILGLLNQSPKTGYDLKRVFEDDIGEFWQAQHSQIYPELKRLEQADRITHVELIAGKKLKKKQYSITASGIDFFDEWRYSPTSEILASKDEFILKLYFIESKKDNHLDAMFAEQTSLHQAKLNHLLARRQTLFSQSTEIDNHYGHYLILEHAINREQDYLNWLTLAQP
ncbi:PadR family transcriptional regulator [Latilactobacillus graminis]|uniref:PadR family transcriptional regulator n=2 Tax=Latilactobacillus graminis TaxID=60519 RepID=A0AA89I6X7_9LACO|nr:PadR family transcriptional regulator [Latilactobacillus graminis]KRM24319.1 PadR family transcriptional regulator [Latilactobacillus graminis DSM 20719]QFP80125.1 PadR family transcriptional regulator [Latilactobacillus graminis]